MSKVALYARSATVEHEKGQMSQVEQQLTELRKFCEVHGYTIVDEYVDEGVSGITLNRPELDRLRNDAGTGKFDIAIVDNVDRLARNNMSIALIKNDLEKRGVKLIFSKLPQGPGGATENLMANILGSFAEFERAMIADRLRRGRQLAKLQRQKVLQGQNLIEKTL